MTSSALRLCGPGPIPSQASRESAIRVRYVYTMLASRVIEATLNAICIGYAGVAVPRPGLASVSTLGRAAIILDIITVVALLVDVDEPIAALRPVNGLGGLRGGSGSTRKLFAPQEGEDRNQSQEGDTHTAISFWFGLYREESDSPVIVLEFSSL